MCMDSLSNHVCGTVVPVSANPGHLVCEIGVSPHPVADCPCFLYHFCLVDTAGLHFDMSFSSGRRGVWQYSGLLSIHHYILLCRWIHDVNSFAFYKSAVPRVAPTMSSTQNSSSSSKFSRGSSWQLLLLRRDLTGWSHSSLPLVHCLVVWFVVGDVEVRGVRSYGKCVGYSLRLYDHPHHPSLCCPEFLHDLLCHSPCS